MLIFHSLYLKSLFEAEEKNAEGFAKGMCNCHSLQIKNDPSGHGKLMVDPEAKLEEELVVRPTVKRSFGTHIKIGFRVIRIYLFWSINGQM